MAGGRDVPWMWLGVGMYPGCGWRWGWKDGPWMWPGLKMPDKGYESKASEIGTYDRTVEKKQTCVFPV